MNRPSYVLAIETSFDDTAAGLIKDGRVLTNIRASQAGFYRPTGGVVPELAARRQAELIIPIIKRALAPLLTGRANNRPAQILKSNRVMIAVTQGPGLLGSLMVGVETAKALACLTESVILPINHLEGHLIASLAGPRPKFQITNSKIEQATPAVGLIVSGGNTLLIYVKKLGRYQTLGQTRDDAAGEAFDKIARLLGLGFPGGPAIAALARQARATQPITLPRPMIDSNDFDFSFAGLKTACGLWLKKYPQTPKPALALALEQAIVDVLLAKTFRAAQKFRLKNVWLTGGVAANLRLRREFKAAGPALGRRVFLSPLELTGDNAAMIGLTAWLKGDRAAQPLESILAQPDLRLS